MNSQLRRQVHILYDHTCVICGSADNLQVHHVDGDKRNDDISNLMLLCCWCHMMFHPNNAEKMIKWLIRTEQL